MRSEVLKGNVDLLLLATLAAESAHGYRIVERVRQRSEGAFDLAEGTVYPALYRLERSGLLESRWEAGDGRRRRVYSVTRKGRAALEQQRGEWQAFSVAMRAVVG